MKKSSTLLDVVYCNSEGLLYQTETIPCTFSDHHFVLAALNLKPAKFRPTLINSPFLSQQKLDQMKELIKTIPFNCLNTVESVEDKFFLFIKLILETFYEIAPLKRFRLKYNNLPWFDQELVNLYPYQP